MASQDQRLDRTTDRLAPGFFTGALSTVGPGLLRGSIEAARTAQTTALQLGSAAIESDLSIGASYFPEFEDGQTQAQQEFGEGEARRIGRETAESVLSLRPDPAEVGVIGQILGEASAVLPRAVLGAAVAGPAGAAAAAGAPAGYSSKQVAMAEGIDEDTATLKGLIDAGTIGIGAVLPAARFVGPVLGDAAIAVGANVGLGMAGRGLTAKVLEDGGYTTQAAQYRVMDGTAIATDAILGAAFFGIGRASMRRPTTEQVDAALSERATQHYDVDTAPGAPVDPRSAMSHQEAMRTAIGQLSRGEPVTVPDSIHSAEFLRGSEAPKPKAPTREEAIATARQELEPTVRTELEEAVGLLPNVADVRAELSGVQRSLEGLDDTFRDRAKQAQVDGMSRKKAEATARQAIEQERQQLTERVTALEESIQGNRAGEIARGELAAIARGETPERLQPRIEARADEIMQGFERSPLATGVIEGNARLNMAQIARQEIARMLAEQDALAPRAEPVGLEIVASKRATPAQQVATEGVNTASKPAKSASEPAKSGSEQPETASPEKDAADLAGPSQADADPTIQLADEIMARTEDMRLPTGALDDEGRPVTVSARELLAQADDDIKAAQQDARGFAAAAACFLQRGLD